MNQFLKFVSCFLVYSFSISSLSVPLSDIQNFSAKAETVASKELSGGRFFMLEALKITTGNCAGKYDWYFHSVAFEKAKSGRVQFSPDSSTCDLVSKWDNDSSTLGMGYYFFDIHAIKLTPDIAASTVIKIHPGFKWNGNFRIFQPLDPYIQNPLYLLAGSENSKENSYLVDAKTGLIVTE